MKRGLSGTWGPLHRAFVFVRSQVVRLDCVTYCQVTVEGQYRSEYDQCLEIGHV